MIKKKRVIWSCGQVLNRDLIKETMGFPIIDPMISISLQVKRPGSSGRLTNVGLYESPFRWFNLAVILMKVKRKIG